jgi:hypothetical protein
MGSSAAQRDQEARAVVQAIRSSGQLARVMAALIPPREDISRWSGLVFTWISTLGLYND